MILARDLTVKACGKTILVTYRGEIMGLFPRSEPMLTIIERCHKRHAYTYLD